MANTMESYGTADEYRFEGTEDQLKPSTGKVLVKWIPQYATKSGILIPPTEDIPYVKGTIISKGEECYDVEVGNTVWIEKYSPHQRVTIGEDLYAFVLERDIVAVVEEEA